jgi:isocitrate dehydrogenase
MQLENHITIPYMEGDGIGPEIMAAARCVLDGAVTSAYGKSRSLAWLPCLAGNAAFHAVGDYLPQETLNLLAAHKVSLKGPLTTPVGGGFTSLNVRLRRLLDLYVCLRPVRWFEGLPSPHRNPQGIDLVIFRENTEDLYAGIEYQPGTPPHYAFLDAFRTALPDDFAKLPYPDECGIGIKPVSKPGSQRLVRAALRWALENGCKRLTLVHKGNIMKYTEGAFAAWGYDLAESEFTSQVFTRRAYDRLAIASGTAVAEQEKEAALAAGALWMDDLIADVTYEQLITSPQAMDVIATTNLNGDYLSDAAAALAGGVGISPGANINFETGSGMFEANHGSAEPLAGKDMANPSSLILSGEMLLRFIGWREAADRVRDGIMGAIRAKEVTFDLARQMEGAHALGTSDFAAAVLDHMA